MKTKLFTVCCAAVTVIMAASCGKLDVVATDSVRAFGEVLTALPPDDTGDGWSISAPPDSARFVWNGERAAIIFDAAPFIEAGLDASKMANVGGGKILFGIDFQSAGREKTNPLADYQRIVSIGRSAIGYHGALDHYGISLGNGNIFEWAKDMAANDKDIVFVLNPAPFLAAGVDPNKIDGWVFAKVTVDDENGKPVEVDKLLKPFNVR